MDLTIRVRETATHYRPPERAVLRVAVALEGPDRTKVAEQARTLSSEVIRRFEQLKAAGALTWVTHQQLQVSSYRPTNQDGKVMPPVYTSSADIEGRFADFGALAGVVDEFAEVVGLRISGVSWDLTTATRQAAIEGVRTEAVSMATRKAAQSAAAAGKGTPEIRMLTDTGMLGDHPGVESFGGPGARALSAGGPAGTRFQPEDIELSASVEAEFVAR